ncbi:hypothetical protein [Haloarchaeobius sp. DFWS5]|uniref:hypothetical protein n=1 Tax=Haloarchaeobius sp. DFWS5 TaxID=3446114 RepID=UPI003EBD489C
MSQQEPSTSQPENPDRVPEDSYCGHFDQLTKARFNQLFNRVAAIRAADDEQNNIGTSDDPFPDIFEFTHQPITVYETGSGVPNNTTKTVSEREILSELQETRSKNFAVVIQGNTGTGKSELCSYLIHQIQDSRPVLEVRKSDDLMTLVTERIPNFYESELGKEFPDKVSYDEIDKSLRNPSEDIPGLITRKATTLLNREGYELSPNTDHAAIQEFLDGKMEVLMKDVEDRDEGTRLIKSTEYEQNEFLQIFEEPTEDPEYDVLNNALWNALLDEFDTPPLEKVLETVGEEFTDVRPVIVFEDFSIAAVQAKQIGQFVERDIQGDPWDFVIAGTSDSIRPLRTQTFLGRYRFFQTNGSDSNQVPFLTNENVVEFVRPYLAYPKTHDGSITYARPSDSNRLLEISGFGDGDNICSACELCSEPLDKSLFPLTETFITRIFDPGLESSERSPRELIGILEQVLNETYYGPTSIPSSASVLTDLNSEITPHSAVYEEVEEFVSLAKWYGESQGDVWEVDRRIPDVFGFLEDYEFDTAPTTLSGGIEITEETVRIPKTDFEIDDVGGSVTVEITDEDDSETEDVETEDDDEPRQLTTVQRIFREHRGAVDSWQGNPGNEKYQDTGAYLATAIEDLLETFTTSYSFWPESSLSYKPSGTDYPFVFANTDDIADPGQIVIDPESFRVSRLFKLLEHGIRLEQGTADRDELIEKYATQFTSLAVRWQEESREALIDNEELLFSKNASRDFDDFIISTYAAICLIEDPWEPVTATRLNSRFANSDDFSFDTSLKNELANGIVTDSDVEVLEDLIGMADCIESLLKARFSVSGNQLNVPTVRRRLGENPLSVLDDLAKTRIDNIDWRVHFSDDNETQLKQLAKKVNTVYSVFADVKSTSGIDIDPEQIIARLDGVTADELRDIHSTIETSYDDVAPPDFLEDLDSLAEHDDTDFDRLRNGARAVLRNQYGFTPQLRQVLGLVKIRANPLVSLIDSIYNEESMTAESVAPRFQEVAKYYVNQ